ncbi:HEAT repeat domain-containing protein [Candidatus Micrarchaeota archaeon]|nr:HEAT repeat domain-containing protein [Candidatus Micrarchaeota archaeon]
MKTLEELLFDLKHGDVSARLEAVKNIANLKDNKAFLAVTNALDDEDHDVRNMAVTSLGFGPTFTRKIRTDEIKKSVQHLMSGKVNERVLAALNLGRLKDKRAVPFLLNALEGNCGEVKVSAIEALGKIKDERAVPYLVKLLEKDEANVIWKYDIRKSTAWALREIDFKGVNMENRVFALLILIKDMFSVEERQEIVKFGRDAVTPFITLLGRKSTMNKMHNLISFCLCDLKDEAFEEVLKGLESDNRSIRDWCISTLGNMRDERAIIPLVRLMTEKPEHGTTSLVLSLSQLCTPELIEKVFFCLQSSLDNEKDEKKYTTLHHNINNFFHQLYSQSTKSILFNLSGKPQDKKKLLPILRKIGRFRIGKLLAYNMYKKWLALQNEKTKFGIDDKEMRKPKKGREKGKIRRITVQ